MTGHWERVETSAFALAPGIEAERFLWHPTGLGEPIEFQAVESRPERRFYPVGVLETLSRGEPADGYIDAIVAAGIPMLTQMETALASALRSAQGGEDDFSDASRATEDDLRAVLEMI
jgi:hypothetical protein